MLIISAELILATMGTYLFAQTHYQSTFIVSVLASIFAVTGMLAAFSNENPIVLNLFHSNFNAIVLSIAMMF
jgi:hypothetical protein